MDGWWCVRHGDALACVEAPSAQEALRRSLIHALGDWTDDARELVVFPQDAYAENAGPHDYTRAVLRAHPSPPRRRGPPRDTRSPASSASRPRRGGASPSRPSTAAPPTTRSAITRIPNRPSATSSASSARCTARTRGSASPPLARLSSTSWLRARRTILACVPRTRQPGVGSPQDLRNLTLASPRVNRHEKRGKDAAQWVPARNRCWFAARAQQR